MTVHKSQGSEFSTVVVVVPALDPLAARQHPLSAQLLYTAATRARQTLVVCSTKADFIQAAKTQGQRGSRLAQRVKAGVVS